MCTAMATLLVGGRMECAHSAELVPQETMQWCRHRRTLPMNIIMSSGLHFGVSGYYLSLIPILYSKGPETDYMYMYMYMYMHRIPNMYMYM